MARPRSFVMRVPTVGASAIHCLPDPRKHADGGLEWQLRYGSPDEVRLQAAEVISGLTYLLGGFITSTEAIRRLRILRREYQNACAAIPQGTTKENG